MPDFLITEVTLATPAGNLLFFKKNLISAVRIPEKIALKAVKA